MTDTVDLSAVQAAPDPTSDLLEPGTYPVTIVDAGHSTSPRKGTPYIKIRAEISTGPDKGRVVFDDWWLTPGAKKMLIDRFRSVGLDLTALPPSFAPRKLIGRHAVVVTFHEDYVVHDVGLGQDVTKTKVRVRYWKADPERPNSTAVASDPLAPAPQVTATPDDDLPW